MRALVLCSLPTSGHCMATSTAAGKCSLWQCGADHPLVGFCGQLEIGVGSGRTGVGIRAGWGGVLWQWCLQQPKPTSQARCAPQQAVIDQRHPIWLQGTMYSLPVVYCCA